VDFETPDCTLVLIIRHKSTGNLRKLQFSNVALNNPELAYLRDATGLYFIDTSYLNWSPDQRIEVGDTDGGPPLFWAEAVEEIHE
jgi:hypothetical protein